MSDPLRDLRPNPYGYTRSAALERAYGRLDEAKRDASLGFMAITVAVDGIIDVSVFCEASEWANAAAVMLRHALRQFLSDDDATSAACVAAALDALDADRSDIADPLDSTRRPDA